MVEPSPTAVGLVVVGHSARLAHIVADYTIIVLPSYTMVVLPFAAEVQNASAI